MKPSLVLNFEVASPKRKMGDVHEPSGDLAFAEVLVDVKKMQVTQPKPESSFFRNAGDLDTKAKVEPACTTHLDQLLKSKVSEAQEVPDELLIGQASMGGGTPQILNWVAAKQPIPNSEMERTPASGWTAVQSRQDGNPEHGLPLHANGLERNMNSRPGLNVQPPAALPSKHGVEKRQTIVPLDTESEKEAFVLPAESSQATRSEKLSALPIGSVQAIELRASFAQLVASELSLEETGKTAKISLHFEQKTDGLEIKRVMLQLHPENLGKLTLSLHRHEDGLRIVVQAQTVEAHAKLTTEKDEILRSLDMIGVSISEISIQPLSRISPDTELVEGAQSLQTNFGQAQSGDERQGAGTGRHARSSLQEEEIKFEKQAGVYI